MELLKANPIIDQKYKPSMDQSYMDYFNRALAFAQTNYNEQLEKASKTHFFKLSPTRFFEEYAWCVSIIETDIDNMSELFLQLSKKLTPFYNSFWDLNNVPSVEDVQDILPLLNNEKKFKAIYDCAGIINRGIKLFGWDRYKDNFLNTPERLCVLPMIGILGAKRLSRNIGLSSEVISSAQLHRLAVHWGFTDSKELCTAIQQKIAMQAHVIEMILWYAAHTFDTT